MTIDGIKNKLGFLVFGSASLKVLAVMVSFLIPALLVREYGVEEFGKYSFFISLSVYVGVFQSGLSPSLRSSLAEAKSEGEKIARYKEAYAKSLKIIYLVFLFAIISLVLFPSYYEWICVLASASISLLHPISSTYCDSVGKALVFRRNEVYFTSLVAVVIFILSLVHVHIFIVALLWLSYKGIYSVFYNPFNGFLFFLKEGFLTKPSIEAKDKKYMFLQATAAVYMFGFNYLLISFFGDGFFGEMSLYQKFIFFPMQIFSAIAPILWYKYCRYESMSDKQGMRELYNINLIFLFFLLMWSVLLYYIADAVVSIYSGGEVNDWSLLLAFLLYYVAFQIKDVTSVYANAKSMFLHQSAQNISLIIFVYLMVSIYDVSPYGVFVSLSVAMLSFSLLNVFLVWRRS